jgi:hypothetical protein
VENPLNNIDRKIAARAEALSIFDAIVARLKELSEKLPNRRKTAERARQGLRPRSF